jgi:predicted aspartyl protease
MVCLAVYPAACLSAQIANNAERPDRPLKFELRERYQVVVRGAIGRLQRLNFLIDTGSMPTMIDSRVARKLGVELHESVVVAFGRKVHVRQAVLPGIQLGSLRVDALPVQVGDLSFAHGLDAVIGLDVLARSSFRIDYERRELTFGPLPPREPAVPLEATPPFLTVQVTLNGHPVRLLVDTGAQRLVLFERRMHDRLPRLSIRGEKVLYHVSGASRLRRVSLPALEIGGTPIGRLEALLSDADVNEYPPGIDGVLGVRAIAGCFAEFDFERNRLGLDQTAHASIPRADFCFK